MDKNLKEKKELRDFCLFLRKNPYVFRENNLKQFMDNNKEEKKEEIKIKEEIQNLDGPSDLIRQEGCIDLLSEPEKECKIECEENFFQPEKLSLENINSDMYCEENYSLSPINLENKLSDVKEEEEKEKLEIKEEIKEEKKEEKPKRKRKKSQNKLKEIQA